MTATTEDSRVSFNNEEIQDRGSSLTAARSGKKKKKNFLQKWFDILFIDSKAFKTFLTNFVLTYNLRAGVAFLVRTLSVLRQDPKAFFSLQRLLDEAQFKFREEAVRIGLFVGLFTGTYKATTHALARRESADCESEKVVPKKWHSAVGGFLAGFSLLIMDKSWHRTLSLYMATRAVQCWYNFNKERSYFHFWGSHWSHGDSLLFAVSSAQIMYAYVMRKETLPRSYHKFIVNQGPIDGLMLETVQQSCRDLPIDTGKVLDYVKKNGGEEAVKAVKPWLEKQPVKLIPRRALHPHTSSAVVATLESFSGVAKKIFPVYLALALVPAMVLRYKIFVKNPLGVVGKALASAAQSSTFLATFCSSYMAQICLQRMVFESMGWRDRKQVYWIAGFFSSASILLEKKGRRSELALYALPRAADSLFLILNDHRLAFTVPYGELLIFCSSMSAIMFFFENHFNNLSPLVAKLMTRFLSHDVQLSVGASSGQQQETAEVHTPKVVNSQLNPLRHSQSTLSLSGSTMAP
mmetsp:Transcript_10702/g.12911  ORF Transcript_10702/g.12911 Transcript_10702/m.12911 type:complete len:521 (-) Transcript_10702:1325-2887(-)